MKKIRVNAQVKAMVSLIESVFNVTYVFIVLFTVSTSYGTLMISAMLYLIILPYVSLMNTSYNKELIIEDGWKTVFQNVTLGKMMKSVTAEIIPESGKRAATSSDNEVSNCSNEIFTTASTTLRTRRKDKILPFQQPNSKGSPSVNENFNSSVGSKSSNPIKEEDQSIKLNQNISSPIDKIITKLMSKIDKEDEYIQYLELLVSYVSNSMQNNEYFYDEFQETVLPNLILDTTYQQRNPRSKGKRSKSNLEIANTRQTSKMALDVKDLSNRQRNLSFRGDENARKVFRENMLKEIQSCSSDDQRKKMLIEKLIDKEESYLL